MTAITCENPSTELVHSLVPLESAVFVEPGDWSKIDPLDENTASDRIFQASDRSLVRLAVAATEVGARFEREGLEFDAAAWMMAPRELFDGRAAIEACMERAGFQRNLLLHGLQLGLDADPEAVDALLVDDHEEPVEFHALDGVSNPDELALETDHSTDPDPQLRTCWLNLEHGRVRIFAFLAVVSDRAEDIVERVIGRFGKDAAAAATFHVGFDHTSPLGVALISDALADTLALCACDPRSALAEGLDVLVEQRFKA